MLMSPSILFNLKNLYAHQSKYPDLYQQTCIKYEHGEREPATTRREIFDEK